MAKTYMNLTTVQRALKDDFYLLSSGNLSWFLNVKTRCLHEKLSNKEKIKTCSWTLTPV